jgi:hypothetical protein
VHFKSKERATTSEPAAGLGTGTSGGVTIRAIFVVTETVALGVLLMCVGPLVVGEGIGDRSEQASEPGLEEGTEV